MGKRRQRGMTLVETLVALAILAGVVLAAYAMTAQSARFTALEQERLVAGVIADNQTTEMLLHTTPPGEGEEETEIGAAGRVWIARRVVTEAGEKLLRIEISVRRAGDAQTLARVDTLRAAE